MKVPAFRRWALAAMTLSVMGIALRARADDQNPAYKSWASHKPGTMVKLKIETEAGGTKTKTDMTQTLSEVTPDKVVIENKSTTEVGGQKLDSPALKTEIPAKGPSAKMTAGKANIPDVKESEETVKIGDKSYKCKVREVTTKTGGMTADSKSWLCDDVPGMMVKTEMKTEGQYTTTSKTELVEVSEK